MPELITCSGCDATWTALGAAHCGSCHRLFATTGLFDLHRHARGEHGGCLDPVTVVRRGGRAMFYRDGMWRGPELSEEAKTARFGRRS